jgi:hypothetical protein
MIPDDSVLCAECIFMPGWFADEKLAEILDPDYVVPSGWGK